MQAENPNQAENPELLPGEKLELPDPEAVPATVTTADAFGGGPPIRKDSDDAAGRRNEG